MKCMRYEMEDKETWREVVEEEYGIQQLNKEDAM